MRNVKIAYVSTMHKISTDNEKSVLYSEVCSQIQLMLFLGDMEEGRDLGVEVR